MKFEVYLNNTNSILFNEIVELTDLTKFYFKEAIDDFNREIQWDGMWDYSEALVRLKSGWKLLVFVPDNKVRGWCWLDVSSGEFLNLWINSNWRNMGWGNKMYLSMEVIAKQIGLDYIHCFVDDWNIIGQKTVKKAGWYEVNTEKC
jgi:ribosomal protein S18 acetylase RimI-like enzyme